MRKRSSCTEPTTEYTYYLFSVKLNTFVTLSRHRLSTINIENCFCSWEIKVR